VAHPVNYGSAAYSYRFEGFGARRSKPGNRTVGSFLPMRSPMRRATSSGPGPVQPPERTSKSMGEWPPSGVARLHR